MGQVWAGNPGANVFWPSDPSAKRPEGHGGVLREGTVPSLKLPRVEGIIDTEEIDGWYANPLDIHPFKYLEYAAYKPLPGVALLR